MLATRQLFTAHKHHPIIISCHIITASCRC